MSWTPARYDINAVRGDDIRTPFTLTAGPEGAEVAVDLTGATILSQMRTDYGPEGTLLATFGVTIDNAIGGQFTLTLPGTETTPMTVQKAVYDVEITLNGVKRTWIRGQVKFIEDASRA